MNQHAELQGIAYDDKLPVAWEMLAELSSDGERHRVDRANVEVLQHLLLLDEAAQEVTEEERCETEHFKRLEAKVDILLSLVTEMMSNNGGLPDRHALAVGTQGLLIHTQTSELPPNNLGSLMRIRLYLDPQLPRPLELYATLASIRSDSFTVNYSADPSFQELLDKYIFRQHRRSIALARRRENS